MSTNKLNNLESARLAAGSARYGSARNAAKSEIYAAWDRMSVSERKQACKETGSFDASDEKLSEVGGSTQDALEEWVTANKLSSASNVRNAPNPMILFVDDETAEQAADELRDRMSGSTFNVRGNTIEFYDREDAMFATDVLREEFGSTRWMLRNASDADGAQKKARNSLTMERDRLANGASRYGSACNGGDAQYEVRETHESGKMNKDFAGFFADPNADHKLDGFAVYSKKTGKRLSSVCQTRSEAERIMSKNVSAYKEAGW